MKSYPEIKRSKGIKETFKDSGVIACKDGEFYCNYYDQDKKQYLHIGLGKQVKCKILDSSYSFIECESPDMMTTITSNKVQNIVKERIVIFVQNKAGASVLKDKDGNNVSGYYKNDEKDGKHIETDNGKIVRLEDIGGRIAKIVFIEVDNNIYRVVLKGTAFYKFIELQRNVGFLNNKPFDKYFILKDETVVSSKNTYKISVFEATNEDAEVKSKYDIGYSPLKDQEGSTKDTTGVVINTIKPVVVADEIVEDTKDEQIDVQEDEVNEEIYSNIPDIKYESSIKPEELPF